MARQHRRIALLTLALALVICLAGAGRTATAVSAQPTPDALTDAWDRLLQNYVDEEGLVDYEGLAGAGRADFEAVMAMFGDADPTRLASDDERKAFWINAYNAVVAWQVVERYPIDSVRDVGALWGLIGGFFKQEYRVAGSDMSADDIEHGTLRATWPMDAEIHWTLVCAAFGCPRLLDGAYRAEGLADRLAARGREFLARPRGLQIDRDSRTLYLSSYFDWYEDDFERVAGNRIDYVLRFAPQEAVDWIRANRDDLRVEIMDYDWTLNDQPKGPRSRRPVPQ